MTLWAESGYEEKRERIALSDASVRIDGGYRLSFRTLTAGSYTRKRVPVPANKRPADDLAHIPRAGRSIAFYVYRCLGRV